MKLHTKHETNWSGQPRIHVKNILTKHNHIKVCSYQTTLICAQNKINRQNTNDKTNCNKKQGLKGSSSVQILSNLDWTYV